MKDIIIYVLLAVSIGLSLFVITKELRQEITEQTKKRFYTNEFNAGAVLRKGFDFVCILGFIWGLFTLKLTKTERARVSFIMGKHALYGRLREQPFQPFIICYNS